jgi:hypothetical protein
MRGNRSQPTILVLKQMINSLDRSLIELYLTMVLLMLLLMIRLMLQHVLLGLLLKLMMLRRGIKASPALLIHGSDSGHHCLLPLLLLGREVRAWATLWLLGLLRQGLVLPLWQWLLLEMLCLLHLRLLLHLLCLM